jgi:hypothetical protein
MTDPRELAQDFLDMSVDYEIQTLARELLKALDERDRLQAIIEMRDKTIEILGGERDAALACSHYWRSLAEKAEAECDRLREALQRADAFIADGGLSDRSAANSARMVIRAALEEK